MSAAHLLRTLGVRDRFREEVAERRVVRERRRLERALAVRARLFRVVSLTDGRHVGTFTIDELLAFQAEAFELEESEAFLVEPLTGTLERTAPPYVVRGAQAH